MCKRGRPGRPSVHAVRRVHRERRQADWPQLASRNPAQHEDDDDDDDLVVDGAAGSDFFTDPASLFEATRRSLVVQLPGPAPQDARSRRQARHPVLVDNPRKESPTSLAWVIPSVLQRQKQSKQALLLSIHPSIHTYIHIRTHIHTHIHTLLPMNQ